MVSVSLAFAFWSVMITPENGPTGASEVVVWPAIVPVIVGATAGLLEITVVVVSTVGVA